MGSRILQILESLIMLVVVTRSERILCRFESESVNWCVTPKTMNDNGYS